MCGRRDGVDLSGWIRMSKRFDNPLPQGHAKGLIPWPSKLEVGGQEEDQFGFRCDGTLQLSMPEAWRMEP